MQLDKGDDFLCSADAARIAGVTPNAVRLWTGSGALPSTETPGGVRLIRRADLDAYLANRAAVLV